MEIILIQKLQDLTGQTVSLKPRNYTLHPNQKKTELLQLFIDGLFDQYSLWDTKHVDIYLLSERNDPNLVTMAYYADEESKAVVYILNRFFADYARSLAHELIHKAQLQKGNLLTITSPNGINDEQPLEDEANFLAGRLVRAFGKCYPEIYDEHLLQ